MRIECTCYRLFENQHGFPDFEPFEDGDGVFDSFDDAVFHMDSITGNSNGDSLYTFSVEVWP